MGVLLALLSALCYGSSDFAAGVAGRRGHPAAVAAIAQPFGLIAAAAAVLALAPRSPTAGALWWGALSGVGSGVGSVALYKGLAVARMSVVAPLSAVLSAAIPALVGIALGEHLKPLAWVGIAAALPAIALVSLPGGAEQHGSRRAGIVAGLVAGAGFALLFIGLDRAGTSAGAWPLLPGQAVAAASVIGWAVTARPRPDKKDWSRVWRLGVTTGVLGGIANLLYLAATGAGQLAVVAVVTALYPAVTVLLARLTLDERWSRLQIAGLVSSALAVAAISVG
jgi:drug/metabolite transporter (DMT)-like permease